ELNLEQFRHIKPKGEEVAVSLRDGRALDSGSGESLLLEAELQGDPGGAPAHQVVVGDMVFVLLTDERDIGQYLSRLLGGRNEGKAKPVAAPVEEIRAEGDTLQFQVRLSVGVLSLAKVQKDVLLKIEKRPTLRWWNRLFPFL
ncbi:MAG: hypothetical protein HY548_04065, partial [Elusimicrobia bacterium]|nr:hypothetical protein [Elusimicrobiota bacterium]